MKDYEMAREQFKAEIDRLNITIDAEFVPFSKSRNAKDNPKFNDYNLNWRATVFVRGQKVMTVDYTKGIAHCPSYQWDIKPTPSYQQTIIRECETGVTIIDGETSPILLDVVDVLEAVVRDCGVLNYADFEDWALSMDYNTDSRKAEKIYNQCKSYAIALREAIGDEELKKLQEIANEM